MKNLKKSVVKIANTLVDPLMHPTGAVILAAGNSTRMGGSINKQLYPLNGIPVLAHTLIAYQRCPLIREIVVVTRPQDFDAVLEIAKAHGIKKLKKITAGGKTRQESSKRGVDKLSEGMEFVAIADGARCLITPEQIAKVCLKAYRHKAASAAHAATDSFKRSSPSGIILETVDRNHLWAVQTPQIFHTALYHAAYIAAQRDGAEVTDDNGLVERLGYRIRLVECGMENMKITTPDDLKLAEAILQYREKTK
ncbi:MAG: 2-C-methyl-D-erythritol 4-phosphate cytidylyltransferase [Clostridia bacterium]|nr:2-C-methyl-D-erythritol 4-phosphate cytidylyltransferase [Clostridia bacterium]